MIMERECGIDERRLRRWLDEEGTGIRCSVSLEELPARVLGTVALPRTRVTFAGDAQDVEETYRRFFLQFVSAGG